MNNYNQNKFKLTIRRIRQVGVSEQIIVAIKKSTGFENSDKGFTIIIENLDELLPNISRHLILGAIVEMNGVEIIDSITGAVNFPAVYFT